VVYTLHPGQCFTCDGGTFVFKCCYHGLCDLSPDMGFNFGGSAHFNMVVVKTFPCPLFSSWFLYTLSRDQCFKCGGGVIMGEQMRGH
jgi:hypothetical protein